MSITGSIPVVSDANASSRSRYSGIALTLGSAASAQAGAALGAIAFPVLGPIGVVAVRQLVAAVILVPVLRPNLRALTARQWRPILGLGSVFILTNIVLYSAVERLGLGLAVTIEFVGPLAIALIASRRLIDALLAVLAGVGVYILVLPGPTSDWIGILLGLLSAVGAAGYILFNRVVGERVPGAQGTAAAALFAGIISAPIVVVMIAQGKFESGLFWYAVLAGIFSSALPYVADLIAIRWISARVFSVFVSVHPVFAAFAGVIILGETLNLHEWVGIVIVAATNATVAILTVRRSMKPAEVSRD